MNKLDIKTVIANHTPEELAKGFIRYEIVRTLNPRAYGELFKLNLSGEHFDDLIDQAVNLTVEKYKKQEAKTK